MTTLTGRRHVEIAGPEIPFGVGGIPYFQLVKQLVFDVRDFGFAEKPTAVNGALHTSGGVTAVGLPFDSSNVVFFPGGDSDNSLGNDGDWGFVIGGSLQAFRKTAGIWSPVVNDTPPFSIAGLRCVLQGWKLTATPIYNDGHDNLLAARAVVKTDSAIATFGFIYDYTGDVIVTSP